MAPKTTYTRKKKQQMKVTQTEDQAWAGLGKRKTLTIDSSKKMKDRQIDDRDWVTGLPGHLIELVIERLPLVDCLSFSGVCKHWRSTTTTFFKASSRGLPLLVKPGQSDSRIRTCLNVLDKNKYSTFDIQMPDEYIGSHIWGSYRDWLFLVRFFQGHIHITLLNPFSGEKVVLPKTYYDDYNMLVLSSVPSDPRCICMLVHHGHEVAFWTSGAQEWHKCGFVGCEGDSIFSGKIVDALYHEGHFYLLKLRDYEIVIIDEKRVLDMLNKDSRNSRSRIVTQCLGLKVPCLEKISIYTRKYLVELSGDIVLVCRIFFEDGPHKNKTSGFETFRLDVSQMAWVKLESMGKDKIIFLGKSCSRSFHVKEELGDSALANNIYFSNSSNIFGINQWESTSKHLVERNDVDDWGVFSLHNVEISEWPRAFCAPGKIWPGIWVSAPIWWCLRHIKYLYIYKQYLENNLYW